MKNNQATIQLLSERETAKRLGLTPQQFNDLTERDSRFPPEVYLSDRLWAYVEHEVDEYIDLLLWHRDERVAAQAEQQYQLIRSRRAAGA